MLLAESFDEEEKDESPMELADLIASDL